MKNLKDTLSTICGVISATCITILALPSQGVEIPATLKTASTIGLAVSALIIGLLQGKNPDGSTKVIDPTTGQQDLNPVITKQQETEKQNN
jgi:hypothetical protein